jgi:hypothetical protein
MANTSVRQSSSLPSTCWRDMYPSLPLMVPVLVSEAMSSLAMPKSSNLTCPSYVTSTL